MSYSRLNWEDTPSTKTPINAENLNKMDQGIFSAHKQLDAIPDWAKEEEKPSYTPEDIGSYTKEEIDALKATSIISTSSGTVFHETDCAAVPPINIKLFGKGKQDVIPGNQLFDKQLLLDNGGIEQADGSIYFPKQPNFCAYINSQKEIGQYCFTINANKETDTNCILLHVKYTDGTEYYQTFGSFVLGEYKTVTLITDASKTVSELWLTHEVAGSFYIKDVMINKGSKALPYEPYVGGEQSPNMNYPQIPVHHGESGSIVGKVLTGNLLSEQNIIDFGFTKIGENEFYTQYSSTAYQKVLFKNIYGYKGQIKVSGLIKYVNPNNISGTILRLLYTDGTYEWIEPSNPIYGEYQEIGLVSIESNVVDCIDCVSYGTGATETYLKDMQVSFDTTSSFSPYTEQPFTLQTPNGLKGVPVDFGGDCVDSRNQKWVTDIIDYSKNEHVQKIKEAVFVGSDDELWQLDRVGNECIAFYLSVPDMSRTYKGYSTVLCDKLIFKDWDTYNSLDEEFISKTTVLVVRIKQERLESLDITGFKKFLSENPLTVWYELADPITTDLTAEELDQYNSLVMNYPITNVVNDAGAYMEVEYVADTQEYIKQNYVPKEEFDKLQIAVSEIQLALVNS